MPLKLRTWLFTPGDDARKLRRAPSSEPDALILDWEDAVATDRKAAAREATRTFLAEARVPCDAHGRGRPADPDDDSSASPPSAREDGGSSRHDCRVGIRINAAGSDEFQGDLEVLASLRPDFVMLPKVEEPAHLAPVGQLGIPIIALLESARGIEAVAELATAHARLERFAFGAMDFCADVHARWQPTAPALAYVRARLVVVSRAKGLAPPVDAIYPALRDLAGLRQEARLARDMGFAGKLLVHPDQVLPVATEFAPDEEDIRQARRILAAAREAAERGSAVLRLDGMLVDSPVVRWAERILADVDGSNGE